MNGKLFKYFMLLGLLLNGYDVYAEGKNIRAFIAIKPPQSFHPNDNVDGISSDHLNQVYDTLFWVDYDGNLQPSLATKWVRVDPLTIEVDLRKGVRFQNGELFDSRSVKLTFDLFLSTTHPAQNRFYGETIKEVRILDPFKVRIITNIPDNLLPFRLATVGLMIPPDYYQEVGKKIFSSNPIGTGPFKFNAPRSSDREMVMEANKSYWGGPPNIDELHFVYFASVDDAVEAFLRGELDYVAHVPGKYTVDISKNKSLRLEKKLTLQSIVLLVNTKKKGSPLANLGFRTILRKGLNFEHVVEYGYHGNGRHSEALTPPESQLYVDIPRVEWRPEEARAELSKLLESKNYKYTFLATKPFDLAGSIVAKQLTKLGLNVEVLYGSDEDEVLAVSEKNQKNIIPDIDFLFTYCANRYAAFPLLVLTHSKANWSLTSNPHLDAMLDQAKAELDADKQVQYFKDAVRYIHENVLVLPAFQLEDVFGLRKGLSYRPHITGYLYFKDMALDKK